MDTDTTTRMTVAEIALMREIVRWRKVHEIEFVRRRVMGTYWVDSFGRTGTPRRSVAIELRDIRTLGLSPDSMSLYEWIAVESVTQAVDVLVALGYLPARFSSAYRAGWHAAQHWYDDQARDDAEFRRLFHDPENISFPAGAE